jgi:hypothetical protein
MFATMEHTPATLQVTLTQWRRPEHEWILSSAIPDAFSVMNGKKPSAEYEQLVSNSRTIGDSLQRLVKQILNNSPQTANMKFDAVPPTVKVGKAWSVYGMKEAQPNATFIGVDKQQKQTMGFAVKIGEQIKPCELLTFKIPLNLKLSRLNDVLPK